MSFQPVGTVDQFPDGRAVEVRLGARRIAVYRLEGEFFALKNLCPHQGVQLHRARPREDRAVCMGHGWEFDLRTGRCLRGRNDQRVAVYAVKVEEGTVYVDVDR